MSLDERVLEHLKTKGRLSQKGAIRLYSAYRLSAIIHRLRRRGYEIVTNIAKGTNRWGDKVHWGEYKLIK